MFRFAGPDFAEPPHYVRILRDSLEKHMNIAFVSYLQDRLPERFKSSSETFVMKFLEFFNGRQIIPNQSLLVRQDAASVRALVVKSLKDHQDPQYLIEISRILSLSGHVVEKGCNKF